ncbi:MAG: hypothetical protein WCJ53_01180 [Mycobacteriaceae bacterium]
MSLGKITAAVFGIVAATASASLGVANADTGSAADIVNMLQAEGYNVQFNMPSEMALYRCTVSGVHGIPVMMMSSGSLMVMMGNPNTTVYVDLDCPDSNN